MHPCETAKVNNGDAMSNAGDASVPSARPNCRGNAGTFLESVIHATVHFAVPDINGRPCRPMENARRRKLGRASGVTESDEDVELSKENR